MEYTAMPKPATLRELIDRPSNTAGTLLEKAPSRPMGRRIYKTPTRYPLGRRIGAPYIQNADGVSSLAGYRIASPHISCSVCPGNVEEWGVWRISTARRRPICSYARKSARRPAARFEKPKVGSALGAREIRPMESRQRPRACSPSQPPTERDTIESPSVWLIARRAYRLSEVRPTGILRNRTEYYRSQYWNGL